MCVGSGVFPKILVEEFLRLIVECQSTYHIKRKDTHTLSLEQQITKLHSSTINLGNIFTVPTHWILNHNLLFRFVSTITTWKLSWHPLHRDELAELTALLHVRYLIFCPSQVLEKTKRNMRVNVGVEWRNKPQCSANHFHSRQLVFHL